jgi:epidermal growth factor receptor substrate 15
VVQNRVEAVPWVVNSGERLRYNVLFKQTDSDHDGFVSGVEIKNVFLQTGLPQNILAHIWNLCDINQEGKLNPEQFALAMWLINRKQSGKDPPAALTPDMVPPSMRPKGQDAGTGSNVYNNPELEMIAKDIQSLLSEKIQLEKESQNTDYNMSVKKTELHSLQSEYDTLASTLKQLTNQKDVAQKRLDDLDTQI